MNRLVLSSLMLLVHPLAYGVDVVLETEMRAMVQHDDNINLEINDQDSVYGEVINPQAKLIMATETWTSKLNADLRFSDFNRAGYDSDDQYVTFSSANKGERYSFGIKAKGTHDTTRTSEAEDSGRFSNERHDYYSVAPNWTYEITRKDFFSVYAEYAEHDYDDPRYTGNENIKSHIEWAHVYSPNLRVTLRATGEIFESDGRTGIYRFSFLATPTVLASNFFEQTLYTETESLGYQIGARYQFNEKLSIEGWFGDMDTETTYTIETENDQCSNPVYNVDRGLCDLEDQEGSRENTDVSITWEEERQSFALSYSIVSMPSSDGYLLESELVRLNWKYQLFESGKIELKGIWGKNETLDSPEGQLRADRSNRDYTTAILKYSHRLNEHWYVEAQTRYRYQDREINTGDAEGLGGSLGISYYFQKQQW